MSDQKYGGAIWTNHALERLGQRGLTQDLAAQAFNRPDKSFPGKNPETTECQKRFGNSLVTVICKKNERNEWIILSCWIDPPLYGTQDYIKKQAYLKSRRSGFWGKLWYSITHQLFG